MLTLNTKATYLLKMEEQITKIFGNMLRISASIPSINIDGNAVDNSKAKANILNSQFRSVFTLRILPIYLIVMASHTLQYQTLQSHVMVYKSFWNP